jgi:dUTP pyrophosphatase
MQVKVVNRSKHSLPEYASTFAAGLDLRANLDADIELAPMDRILVPTGLYIQIPDGYEGQVRPRSGLAIKHGVTVLNSPGTIDSDYRGEVKVILVNLGTEKFIVKDGERIAQLIVAPHQQINWEAVEKLDSTERNEGGFGHTGRN